MIKRIDVPRLLVTGLGAGVGKTTLCLALLHELRRRGVQVGAAITAPHLQIASVYEKVTGRCVTCLDPTLLSRQQILEGLERASTGCELLVIDGFRGLMDGGAGDSSRTDAEVAALTHTPILFVVDVRQVGATIAGAVRGVQLANRGLEWIGVALNRCSNSLEGRGELVAAFDRYKAPAPLVTLPELDPVPPFLPNFVSQNNDPTFLNRHFLTAAADALAMSADIEQIIARASTAPGLDCELEELAPIAKVRIAVARDACFSLLFQDNLEILSRLGAELCEFSPLIDAAVPAAAQGIYFPGGYVGEYGPELALNEALRTNLSAFLARGGGIYAEGAALGYLASRFNATSVAGEYPGIGLFPASGIPSPNVERGGRVAGTLLDFGLPGEAGDLMRGYLASDWSFTREPGVARILRVSSPHRKAFLDGYAPSKNVFGSFGFWHFGSCPSVARSLVHTFAGPQSRV